MTSKSRKPPSLIAKQPPSKNVSKGVVAILMYDYHVAEDNGKQGLIGVFDTLAAPQFPARFSFFLFIKFTGEPGQHSARIELIDKVGGRKVLEFPDYGFNLPSRPVTHHNLITQVNMEFPSPGVQEWSVYYDDVLSGQYPFQVVIGDQ